VITLRKSSARGHSDHGWLNARHTFSFAEYHDPAYMGFSVLRVINDDVVAPGRGFGMHPHRDMEIVTYILQGALQHHDSMGNGSVIRAGDVQYMSAGSGVRHSEVNPSLDQPVHLLQIWILPAQQNLVPQYDQKTIPVEEKRGRWRMLASSDGREDSILIQQDASLLATVLDHAAPLTYQPRPGRRQYLHLARGSVALNGIEMDAGDGAFIENESVATLSDAKDAEALLFDLPWET
jgi:redox-sensitive bicupin YhaK (pirin superfamily)